MGRLGNISGKEAARAFGKAGWQVVGQVGSHVVMTKSGMRPISRSHSTKIFRPEHFER
jgi:predicted RNA binding protein YcfA (HicA-like mRNA interferase family)